MNFGPFPHISSKMKNFSFANLQGISEEWNKKSSIIHGEIAFN